MILQLTESQLLRIIKIISEQDEKPKSGRVLGAYMEKKLYNKIINLIVPSESGKDAKGVFRIVKWHYVDSTPDNAQHLVLELIGYSGVKSMTKNDISLVLCGEIYDSIVRIDSKQFDVDYINKNAEVLEELQQLINKSHSCQNSKENILA